MVVMMRMDDFLAAGRILHREDMRSAQAEAVDGT